MIDENTKTVTRSSTHNSNGNPEGRRLGLDDPSSSRSKESRGLHWQNAREDAEGKVYRGHGLRVFQGFGPHIKRFGMSFEVSEDQLALPPVKKELYHVESYYGSYDWPPQQYARFANLAGLERTADETLRMKAAFSNLKVVQDLGLSIDSGLGWLNGPDRSVHARVFQRPPRVFGESKEIADQQSQDATAFWTAIQQCHRSLGVLPNQTLAAVSRPSIQLLQR